MLLNRCSSGSSAQSLILQITWLRLYLQEAELMKVVGIKYEIHRPRGPRLVCLKLEFIDLDTGRSTGAGFSIK